MGKDDDKRTFIELSKKERRDKARKLLFGDYQNISGTNHVAFSPLENYLFYRNPYGTLCRLNISNWENMDSIANSFKLFETSMNSRFSAGMKFGPNKKLYVNAGDITEYEGNWDEENLIIIPIVAITDAIAPNSP